MGGTDGEAPTVAREYIDAQCDSTAWNGFRFRDGDVSHGRSHLAGEDQYSCPGLGRWSVWGRSDCLLLGPP